MTDSDLRPVYVGALPLDFQTSGRKLNIYISMSYIFILYLLPYRSLKHNFYLRLENMEHMYSISKSVYYSIGLPGEPGATGAESCNHLKFMYLQKISKIGRKNHHSHILKNEKNTTQE